MNPVPLERSAAERLVTPALLVDLAACRRNLAAALARIGSPDRWRPHVKTAKIPGAMALYLELGIRQFKCATLREARVLAASAGPDGGGPADILLAHHLHGPSRPAFLGLAAEHPEIRFATLVESTEAAVGWAGAADLFIDVDLGMERTGIGVGRVDEIVAIARAAGERFRGLHAYDGHRHEADMAAREERAHRGYDRLLDLVAALGSAGMPPGEVITSGTPAHVCALTHRGLAELPLHRVSPGTVIYHDLRSAEQLGGAPEFAATVLARVASLPGDDLFTVDAGSKAIEAAGPDLIARCLEHPGATALRQSEEHTVFRVANGEARPTRGAVVRLVPGHVCPTVNLASRCQLLEDGRLIGETAVAARGH